MLTFVSYRIVREGAVLVVLNIRLSVFFFFCSGLGFDLELPFFLGCERHGFSKCS